MNPNAILVFNNSTAGARAWTSVDAGLTWSTNGDFGGDPGTAIIGNDNFGPHGRFVVLGLAGVGPAKVEAHYKDLPGSDWTSVSVTETGPTDKGTVWVDNSFHSSNRFRLYASWTEGGGQIVVASSGNSGMSWPLNRSIEHVPGENFFWGANLQTGRTGRVYLMWSRLSELFPSGTTHSFGFSEMTSLQSFLFQPETVLLANAVHDVNPVVTPDATTAPSMAVDRSDSNQDHLFLVWADNRPSLGPDIMMMKGTASLPSGSVVWESSNLIRVNANAAPTADQWWPWITWDECSDMLAVVYMEKIGSTVNTRIAVTENHGATWTDVKVSDVGWNGAQSNDYDFIGVGSGDGRAFPGWSDNREGGFRPYTSPLLLWGVTVSHTIEALPDNVFRLTVTWTSNVRADAGDSFVLTPPPGISLVESPVLTISGDGKTHTATYTGPCVPSGASWNYVLSSRRTGCIQSRTESRSFKVLYCVE